MCKQTKIQIQIQIQIQIAKLLDIQTTKQMCKQTKIGTINGQGEVEHSVTEAYK